MNKLFFLSFLVAAVSAQSGVGKTTRYWLVHLFLQHPFPELTMIESNRDCCKPSCSWSGKADVNTPVRTCNRQGTLLTDPNAVSGCDGGDSFTCTNMSPWIVDDNTAYGFAAVNIAGGNERTWCCECYELAFTSGPVAGKKMVRAVSGLRISRDANVNRRSCKLPTLEVTLGITISIS